MLFMLSGVMLRATLRAIFHAAAAMLLYDRCYYLLDGTPRRHAADTPALRAFAADVD